MKRRTFLQQSVSALALTSLFGRAAADAYQQAFRAALPQAPWLAGLETVAQPAYDTRVPVTGQWPAELRGTLYRNGPARHDIGDFRYKHWFDGDGMLHAYRFDGTTLRHQAKMVMTTKYTQELAAGRPLYPGFASPVPNPAPVSSADAVNVANISVLYHHNKLLALWEAGSPWEMNAETLDTLGTYSFSADTDGAPFSAHPRVEPDGTLWNFGYLSAAGLLALWHIDAQGRVVKVGTVPSAPMGMPHDFVVTARHIVVLMCPLHYRGIEGSTFLDAHEWAGDDPTRVLVIDKNDFSSYRWFELPAQWVFHFGNAWEDAQGVIHFDAARAPTPAVMQDNFRRYMRGDSGEYRPSQHYSYRIDTRRGKAEEVALFDHGFATEFPVIDPRVSCRRNDRLVMLHRKATSKTAHPMLSGVSTYSYSKEQLQSYDYPATVIPEEHLYVPRPGSAPEQDGWIVGTALDFGRLETQLNVFDVQRLEDGPIASASLPYTLPLGLHGKYVA